MTRTYSTANACIIPDPTAKNGYRVWVEDHSFETEHPSIPSKVRAFFGTGMHLRMFEDMRDVTEWLLEQGAVIGRFGLLA